MVVVVVVVIVELVGRQMGFGQEGAGGLGLGKRDFRVGGAEGCGFGGGGGEMDEGEVTVGGVLMHGGEDAFCEVVGSHVGRRDVAVVVGDAGVEGVVAAPVSSFRAQSEGRLLVAGGGRGRGVAEASIIRAGRVVDEFGVVSSMFGFLQEGGVGGKGGGGHEGEVLVDGNAGGGGILVRVSCIEVFQMFERLELLWVRKEA